ncbi:hypothetical protein Tco_1458608 [Tanacetum coccineum]
MNLIVAQQVSLDNALVAPKNRVIIGICNMRIDPSKTLNETTYKVVLDALALTACYPAFLITTEVPQIYMHPFWHTITKIKKSSLYKFKLDKKKCTIDVEVFHDILQICPRLLNKKFDAPYSDEEIVTFIKELGHKGDIKSVTEVVVDHMRQPWRTFATIVNICLSGKTSYIVFQIDNRDAKKQEKMYYPRFTKAIIHHFISKDKSISMRNRIFMHTVRDDSILAFATRAVTPKKERKIKKPASPLKKKDLVAVEEPAAKPVKKPAARRQTNGVQITNTPSMFVSKKKAPAKVERSKGIELLYDPASLEEAQLKMAIKRSKRETNIHQAYGSSEGADLESEVPDEPKGKSIDTSEGTGLKPGVPDVSKADSSESKYESWGDSDDDDNDNDQQSDDERTESDDDKSADLNKTDDEEEDEFVHTPDDYVPTDDENVDDEEYECINKEMYDDVNMELKDAEPANEEKGDEEMTHAEHVNADHEEVSQEVAGDQVRDNAQATVMAASTIQKTEVPLQSSSISLDYATKFLNFDNILSGETEIISMMDIKVQHEDPSIQTSPLLTVPVTVIPETSSAPTTTIPPHIQPFISLQ